MPATEIRKIKLDDTGKEIVWINGQRQEPQESETPIYSIRLTFERLNTQGTAYHRYNEPGPVFLYVEKETLVKAGYMKPGQGEPAVPQEETVEDLVLRLMAKVGIEPQG